MPDCIYPFNIAVSNAALLDLRERLARTRWPEDETVDDWRQGPPIDKLRGLCDYWQHDYDWRRCEAMLNNLGSSRTDIDGIGLHFLHVQSRQPDATPLLLAHGWPGSILEFAKVIGPLANPAASGAPAFHVVVPSIPGFGFSDKPQSIGWGIDRIAASYVELMRRLGYMGWICQGGDLGSAIAESVGRKRPEACIGIHLNMVFFRPTPLEMADATLEEQGYLARMQGYFAEQWGYAELQGTRPQTIGFALADSPAGQAAWIYEKFFEASDNQGQPEDVLTVDEMLDNITLYWLTNTGASSAKLYWELRRKMPLAAPPPIDIATGYSGFAGETILASRRWLDARFSKLVYFNQVSCGGHFAALEQPEAFVTEIRAFKNALNEDGYTEATEATSKVKNNLRSRENVDTLMRNKH